MVYTTYYSKLRSIKDIPYAIVQISVSKPKDITQDVYAIPELYPSWDLLDRYKCGVISWDDYVEEYNRKLSLLNPERIWRQIQIFSEVAGTDNIMLCCWEGSDKPCHRHLVAQWFRDAGYEVYEYLRI